MFSSNATLNDGHQTKLFGIFLLQKLVLWHFCNHDIFARGYMKFEIDYIFCYMLIKRLIPMIKTSTLLILHWKLWVITSKQVVITLRLA